VIQQEPVENVVKTWGKLTQLMIKTWDCSDFSQGFFARPTHKDIKRLGFSNKDIYGLV